VRFRIGLPTALAAATATLVACGGSDDESAGRAAPTASQFPPADGRTLEEVLAEADSEGPVISPTGMVFERGENRYAFGVFDPGGEQLTDSDVALYIAHGPEGEARGPFPARIEDLSVEGPFQSRTVAEDPDAAKVVYVTELDFDSPGEWRVAALVRSGDSLQASRVPSAVVGAGPDVPDPGDRAPSIHTPTPDDVGDISEIETRDPPDTMHEDDLAEALAKQPAVLLFATPALCQSRVCGPVVDIAEQVKSEYGDEAAFIHMEIYEDNLPGKGVREQVRAYNLPTEPWLFVIDRSGRISTAIEGAFSAEELEAAVQEVTG
jgi:hypothetical protein